MKLFNNTPMTAYYGISGGNAADCGTIPAHQTVALPHWNNQKNVKIAFSAVGKAPPGETCPFSITIPKSGVGMAVTIGLYQQ